MCRRVFPKLPSSPATLWRCVPGIQCMRGRWEFSPVSRLLQARIKVLLAFRSTNCELHSTRFYFSFFIGILVPVYVRVITFTVEVPHRLQYTMRHDGGHASFVGVCWGLLALHFIPSAVFREMALYVEGLHSCRNCVGIVLLSREKKERWFFKFRRPRGSI